MSEEVPKGWVERDLTQGIAILSGYPFESSKFSNDRSKIGLIRIRDLIEQSVSTFFNGRYDETYEIKHGDILVGMDGDFNIVKWKAKSALLNQRICKITTSYEIFCIDYIFHDLRDELKKIHDQTGSTTVKHLSTKDIKGISKLFPPLPEQKKIASILTSVDEVIENTQKQIDKLQDLKKATMNELLTKGIVHTEFKNSDFGCIPEGLEAHRLDRLGQTPEGWRVQTVGQFCRILDSQRVPLNSDQRRLRQGCYPYYGANGIQDFIDDYLFDGDAILLAEDGGNFDQYQTRPIAQWVTGKYWVNNHAHILRAENYDSNKWVYYSLTHANILKFINGGTRTKLNQADLKEIELFIPPLSEQKEIVSILSSMDKTIEQKQERLRKIQFLKKSLMQVLLTGKKRLEE